MVRCNSRSSPLWRTLLPLSSPASSPWTPKDWLAVYATVASTVVFIWNCYTWTRGNRPYLVAFLERGRGDGTRAEVIGPQSNDTGVRHQVTIHSRGGAATTIHGRTLWIAPRWCPKFCDEYGGCTSKDHPKWTRNYRCEPSPKTCTCIASVSSSAANMHSTRNSCAATVRGVPTVETNEK